MHDIERRATLALIAAAGAGLALGRGAAAAAAPATHPVETKGFAFRPRALTIRAGDTVQWVNRDSAPHTATEQGGAWTTPRLGIGQRAEHRFDEPASVRCYCSIHPSMRARINVTE